jgi:hypothetical protein
MIGLPYRRTAVPQIRRYVPRNALELPFRTWQSTERRPPNIVAHGDIRAVQYPLDPNLTDPFRAPVGCMSS